jgi:hypothetical protein
VQPGGLSKIGSFRSDPSRHNESNSFDNLFLTDSGSINFDPGNDVHFDNVFNNAFNGAGTNTGFALNQVVDLVDNDSLSDVNQANSGSVSAAATGGIAHAHDGIGTDDGGWGGRTHARWRLRQRR